MPVTRDTALEAVAERLNERSRGHCLRVAHTAERLAGVYGVDAEHAWLAGLLHDWDKELHGDDLVAAAERDGLTVTAIDRLVPYLLHARTAAADVARRFPELPSPVITAIGRHTLGAPGMSDLDIVVFVADMLEPARDFPRVEELRALVGEVSAHDLFFSAYRASLEHLIEESKLIHPETIAVWNHLVSGGAS